MWIALTKCNGYGTICRWIHLQHVPAICVHRWWMLSWWNVINMIINASKPLACISERTSFSLAHHWDAAAADGSTLQWMIRPQRIGKRQKRRHNALAPHNWLTSLRISLLPVNEAVLWNDLVWCEGYRSGSCLSATAFTVDDRRLSSWLQ